MTTLKLTKSEAESHVGKYRYFRLVNTAQMYGLVHSIDLDAETPYVCVTWNPDNPNDLNCWSVDSFQYLREPSSNRDDVGADVFEEDVKPITVISDKDKVPALAARLEGAALPPQAPPRPKAPARR